MIYLTVEQSELVNLIDRLLSSVDKDELRDIVEKKEIVLKLKGESSNMSTLTNFLLEVNSMGQEISNLKNDNMVLKHDFQKLLIALNKSVFTFSTEFDSLKRQHNIY